LNDLRRAAPRHIRVNRPQQWPMYCADVGKQAAFFS
jgi:hypothetical protein